MTTEKTSIWIGKLSQEGKAAMHSFLLFFNTEKMDELMFALSATDQQALSVIFGRLKLQNSVEKINKAISEFNLAKKLDIELIKE